MRDLTKSMMSFSWALSLFGLRQMACMLTPQSWRGAGSSFDHVARSTEGQLDPVTQSIFRAGDNLQSGMVDLMFNMLGLGMGKEGPGDTLRRSAQWGADVVERSADSIRQAAADAGGKGTPASGGTGWGPMPSRQ